MPSPLRKPIGKLQLAIQEALRLRAGLLRDGNSERETDHIVGQGLKAVMGHPREEPWRFLCKTCRDTGWVEIPPSVEQEARLQRLYGADRAVVQPGYVKCDFCPFLEKERKERMQRQNEPEDEFTRAGNVKRGRR